MLQRVGSAGAVLRNEGAEKAGQRRERRAQVLINQRGEVRVAIARFHFEKPAGMGNRNAGRLYLKRARKKRARWSGNHIPASERIVDLRQRSWIASRNPVIRAAVGRLLPRTERLPAGAR